MDKVFHGVLLQSLSFPLQPLLTCHWDPSCWCPSQKQATPPSAGRTATTHSNRSDRGGREAPERQVYLQRHGGPCLHHDRLCHKPVDRVRLKEEFHKQEFRN